MVENQAIAPRSVNPRSWNFDRLFAAAEKDTIIRLRWPLVILSSYWLYYTPSHWLTPSQVQGLLILYLLSHATLYFLTDKLFDSPYVYGPLLLFDTLVLLVVVEMGGSATPDFIVACLLTLVLSCICNDPRGLLAVTLLAPLVYAYFVFSSAAGADPNAYVRLPFPFVISLFYGYFAQVERLRKAAREKEEQARWQQKAAEDLRRQRERLEVLHEVNLALTSTIDGAKVLDGFLTRALVHLPYAAAVVRLRNSETGSLETAAAEGIEIKRLGESNATTEFIDGVVTERQPLMVDNIFADARTADLEMFKEDGLVAFVVLPLVANNEALGCLTFLSREEHQFGTDEIDFLSTLASQVAISIHHSRLYEWSQRQADHLRHARKIKDGFVKSVSGELNAPLNVISGYADMFREGLLGELTPIQEKALETIARQTKELQSLISSVLLITNLEAESIHAELHDLNVWEFVAELRAAYGQPRAKNISLIWNYPADLPTVQSDRSKLEHILRNLIDNAIKFTDVGTVTITVRYLTLKKLLEFKIADTGVGIPATQLTAIFERFRQAEGIDAAMPRGGLGLGLYVVKKCLDGLGGSIDVESHPGVGSIFTLQIPAPLQGSEATEIQQQLLSEVKLADQARTK